MMELRGLLDVDAVAIGGRGDWRTLSDGDPESGGRGRNIRIGTLRNGWDEGGSRMLDIR